MTFSRLLPVILLVTTAIASPLDGRQNHSPSLQIQHKASITGGMKSIISKDRTRLQALISSRTTPGNKVAFNSFSTGSGSVPSVDNGLFAIVQVQVGNPPSTYNLLVDTGSSNTFVGANASYVPTNSSQDTGSGVAVKYGSGSFSGEEFLDDLTLQNGPTIRQSIGVANQSQGFQGVDGILGLGPDDLTLGTLSNNKTAEIQTVTDNLVAQGFISSALVGISIPLTTTTESNGGSVDFGAPDSTKFTGEPAFVPITGTAPSSEFWGIDQSITYGNGTLPIPILSTTSGIVDTGTTLLFIATEGFQAYASATGASLDNSTGLLKIDNPDNLESLFFQIGNTTLEFTANAQIFPRSLNTEIGGDSNATYLIVQDNGPSGKGLDFVNGFTFLQRFYSIFDTPNQQVGFAYTPDTYATSN